jgi:hypothetical protein
LAKRPGVVDQLRVALLGDTTISRIVKPKAYPLKLAEIKLTAVLPQMKADVH